MLSNLQLFCLARGPKLSIKYSITHYQYVVTINFKYTCQSFIMYNSHFSLLRGEGISLQGGF